MHRSGTSACTRVLNLLGCALPDDLIGASDGNELGHWESLAAVTLNDQMLASAGSSWEDWGPLNQDWRQSSVRSAMVGRAMAVVEDHARLGALFVLKDPRLCRLADLWLEAMTDAGIEPLALLMLRHPAEVSASLENRDLMAPGYGHLLWLRHVLDAEYYSRGHKRVVCRFDQLMTNWFETIERVKTGLGIALPRNSPTVHAEIEQFLSHEHRHHLAGPERIISDPALSVWLRRTYAIMLAWNQKGENPADYAELDEIRQEFDRSYMAFARLLLPRGVSGEFDSGSNLKRELAARLAEAQHATDALRALTEQTNAELAAAAARTAELGGQIEAGHAHAAQLQAEIETLRAETARLGDAAADAEALRAREAALAANLADVQAANAQANAQLEQERHQRLALEDSLRAATEALHAQQLRNAELTGRNATAESALAQRQEELSQLWAQLRVAETALTTATVTEAQERERRLLAEQRAAAISDDLAGLTSRLQQAQDASRAQLDRQAAEIAQLTQLLQDEAAATQLARAAETREREQRLAAEQRSAALTTDLSGLQARIEQDRAASARQAERMASEMAQLTRLLQEQEAKAQAAGAARGAAEQEAAARNEANQQLTARLHQQESAARAADTARAAAEHKLALRFDEIARLTAMLSDESGKAGTSDANAKWLRSAMQVAAGFPKWWVLMPQDWRRKREQARYRRSGLFDAEKYLETYPDVASDGMDPVRHYILHGMAEGRKLQ
jgi:hypothetical protein